MTMQQRKHPAKAVSCPFCGSGAGEPCMTRTSGETYQGVHAVREKEFYSAAGRALQAMKKKAEKKT